MIADSRQRLRAVSEAGLSFAVEASAGTGKTRTLIDRILHLALEEGPKGAPLSLSSVCAITFTEKAAGELKIRLRQELEKVAGEAGARAERARGALRELETAAISTFHAFAVSLLKERPIEAGLDPRFTTLDELQGKLFFLELWEAWINGELTERREPLEKALREGITLDQIRDLAQTLREHAHRVRRLRLLPPPTDEELNRELGGLLEESGQYAGLSKDSADLLAVMFEGAIAWLEDPSDDLPPDPRKGGRCCNWSGGEETVRRVRDFVTRVHQHAKYRAEAPARRVLHALIVWLIEEFLPEWEERKRARGWLDFDDQLRAACRLLASSRAARQEFQRRFATLLVDEFQDTDPVQLEIVLLLASTDLDETAPERLKPESGRLFVVGDPKQSIYRFRGADIETYLETVDCRKLAELNLERLELTVNFRSVPSILQFVDAAFENVMIRTGHYQSGYLPFGGAGARSEEESPPSVYILGGRDEEGEFSGSGPRFFEIEARRVARLVTLVHGSHDWKVEDHSGHTPHLRLPGFGDIAVLLPVLTKVDVLEDALRDSGVPYVLEGGKSYYARSEVGSAITVLQAIANPNDGAALYGGLRSVFFGLSDEDLLCAHLEGIPLDYRAEAPGGSPLQRPYEILRELHRRRQERPASETFEDLLSLTGAREVLATHGFQSLANLGKLSRQLRFLQKDMTFSEMITLLSMIDHESLAESESRLVEEKSDAVRVMSIHRAKGLDFPIVIVACLGSERRFRSSTLLADPHGEGIFGVKLGSKSHGWSTPGWERLVEEDRKREDAELIRLLYVALTRSRDHLVVGVHHKGRFDKAGECWKPFLGNTRLQPLAGILSGRFLEGRGQARLLDVEMLDSTREAPAAVSCIPEGDPASILRREYAELERLVTETPRPHGAAAAESAGEGVAVEERETDTARSRAVRLGVAFHEAMELVDFENAAGIRALAADVAVRHKLDGHATSSIEEMMRRCLDSDLIGRAREAVRSGGRLFREMPFILPVTEAGTPNEGKIDLIFEEAGGLVLVDYKTDRFFDSEPGLETQCRLRYSVQIRHYAGAIGALGLKIKAAYLLLARTGQSIQIE